MPEYMPEDGGGIVTQCSRICLYQTLVVGGVDRCIVGYEVPFSTGFGM